MNYKYTIRKKLKKTIISTLCFSMALSFSACGPGKSEKPAEPSKSVEKSAPADIDIKAFARLLKDEISFTSALTEIDETAIENFFDIDADYDAVMYSSDSTCEQLAVFRMKNIADISGMRDSIKTLLSDQKDTFAMYSAIDAERIDKAVIKEAGEYIAFCVCDEPDKAGELMEDILSGKTDLSDHKYDEKTALPDPSDKPMETEGPDETSDIKTAAPDTKTPEPTQEPEPTKEPDGENTEKPTITPEIIPSKAPSSEVKNAEGYDTIINNGKVKKYDNYYVIGDSCFYFYSYAKKSSERYADALNKLAGKLEGKATVYSIPVMTASGIVFPDNCLSIKKGGSMNDGVNKINANLSDKVKKINMYDTLMKHRTEYLFFRTDHHWTALGAYYAYTDFCKAKGVEAESLDSYKTETFDNFKGSYSFTTNDPDMIAHLDQVTVYYPNAKDAKLYFYDEEGNKKDWPIIANVKKAKPGGKYNTFAAGDKPLTVITNNDIKDDSACIVIKDSYGNAFVPFLVDHYHKIYEMDFRYWDGDLAKTAEEYGVKDVLFVVSILNTGNQYCTTKILNMCE